MDEHYRSKSTVKALIKCFSSRIAVVFAQSNDAMCLVEN